MTLTNRKEHDRMEAIVFGLIKQADEIEATAYREGVPEDVKGVLMVAAQIVRSLAISADAQFENVVDEAVRMQVENKENK